MQEAGEAPWDDSAVAGGGATGEAGEAGCDELVVVGRSGEAEKLSFNPAGDPMWYSSLAGL